MIAYIFDFLGIVSPTEIQYNIVLVVCCCIFLLFSTALIRYILAPIDLLTNGRKYK